MVARQFERIEGVVKRRGKLTPPIASSADVTDGRGCGRGRKWPPLRRKTISRSRSLSESYTEQFCKKQYSIVQRLLKALRRKAAERLTAQMTLTSPTMLFLPPGAVDGAA